VKYIEPFLLKDFNNQIAKALFFENQGVYVKK